MRFLHLFKKLQSNKAVFSAKKYVLYIIRSMVCIRSYLCTKQILTQQKADDQGGAATAFKERLLVASPLLSEAF
jgi:hypothetical protein